ncbi:hypothetical protein D9756_004348 [Leucocoprinus leucothites]|uniref:Tyrosine specific protein phosphatases domain-containing protein n=1 Tax=Leucocoprinus leucothites TaxID=201217 RepID=A0A8H5DBE9_9AGAR|nr:hypothetical protein D9756_004348 [Leucoagaricus leucothites]
MQTLEITPTDLPFIQVEGTFNFRAVGGYAISSTDRLRVKPKLLYRCGELSAITEAGAKTLTSLNVKTVFDLRAKNEAEQYKTAPPNLESIKVIPTPIDQELNFSQEYLTAFLRKFEVDELNAFLDQYRGFLAGLGPALEATIRHIIDVPEHPFITHCTVGKDRTGLLVAMILLTLGVDEAEIAQEYALTTVGLEPVWEILSVRMAKSEAFRNNPIGAQNLGASKMETMVAVLKMLKDEYGSAEKYIFQKTMLTPKDLEAFRKNALTKS